VTIEPFTPSSSSSSLSSTSTATITKDDTYAPSKILRVTVMDNGIGMTNIQQCVEAFRSSKGSNNTSATTPAQHQQRQQEQPISMTAGRYGIGLTLCLLHAQRLVPNSVASITSATATDEHFTRAKFVIDTDQDSVRCVDRAFLPKEFSEESGTSVTLLVPGGITARLAWPRLANYFARFRLSLGITCSLEVMAMPLTKVPFLVRPPMEQEKRKQQQQQQQLLLVTTATEDNMGIIKQAKEEEETWAGVFDDQEDEDEDGRGGGGEIPATTVGTPLQGNTMTSTINTSAKTRATLVSPVEANKSGNKSTTTTNNAHKENSTHAIHRAAEVYLGHPVNPASVACSRQPIRTEHYFRNTQVNKTRSRRLHTGPSLEVTLIVCGVPEEELSDQLADTENLAANKDCNDETTAYHDLAPSKDATMTIVRMVNQIPLLDGSEASSCGIVQGILQKRRVWNSFGLEVSSTGARTQESYRSRRKIIQEPFNEQEVRYKNEVIPTFQVRDSDQVRPFLRNANHALFDDPCEKDGSNYDNGTEEEEGGDYDDNGIGIGIGVEDAFSKKRRRRKKTNKKWILPARVRLGNILVLVQIDAEPSQLPLPTLSKGRLPTDNIAIDKALESALMECLRSIQKTNPSLWLTALQLKKAERDACYVPSVASSLAAVVCRSNNADFRKRMTQMVRSFDVGLGLTKTADTMENGDEVSSTTSASPNFKGEDDEAHETPEDKEHESASYNKIPQGEQCMIRELRRSIESRLRKVVSTHVTPKKQKTTKRIKGDKKDNDEDEDESIKTNSDSLVSYDFSAASDDQRHVESPQPPTDGGGMVGNLDDSSERSAIREECAAIINTTIAFNDEVGNDDDWLWE